MAHLFAGMAWVGSYIAARSGCFGIKTVHLKDEHEPQGFDFEVKEIKFDTNVFVNRVKVRAVSPNYGFTDDSYFEEHWSIRPMRVVHSDVDGNNNFEVDASPYRTHLMPSTKSS
jgi:hypothetical protein